MTPREAKLIEQLLLANPNTASMTGNPSLVTPPKTVATAPQDAPQSPQTGRANPRPPMGLGALTGEISAETMPDFASYDEIAPPPALSEDGGSPFARPDVLRTISGFGAYGYEMALDAAAKL